MPLNALQSAWEWLASIFRANAPQKADFEALQLQWQKWGEAQAAEYQRLVDAQSKRISVLEASADKYREWATRHIEALENSERACRAEAMALRDEVAQLRQEVAQLRAKLAKVATSS